jgi:hypothetical protein
MQIFGKSLTEYLAFQRVFLGLILVVGVLRLALSLAGVGNDTVRWLSVTVVALAGWLYYSIRVHTSGFGSYRHLLPLLVNQHVLAHGIVVIGLVIAIFTGQDNIYSAPEYSGGGDGKNWVHVAAHVGIGMIGFSLVLWGLGSLVMLIARKASPRAPATA